MFFNQFCCNFLYYSPVMLIHWWFLFSSKMTKLCITKTACKHDFMFLCFQLVIFVHHWRHHANICEHHQLKAWSMWNHIFTQFLVIRCSIFNQHQNHCSELIKLVKCSQKLQQNELKNIYWNQENNLMPKTIKISKI